MKKWVPWILTGLAAVGVIAWVAGSFGPAPHNGGFDLQTFGKLPVLLNGRIQPMDSVARNALLVIHNSQSVAVGKGRSLSPVEWLAEVTMRPDKADNQKLFPITNPDLLGLMKLPADKQRYFSFNNLSPQFAALEKEARRVAKIDNQQRTPYERQLAKLHYSLGLYQRLKNSLCPEGADDFAAEIKLYQKTIGPGLAALQAQQQGGKYNPQDLQMLVEFFHRYQRLSEMAYPWIIPPVEPGHSMNDWANMGKSLMTAMRSQSIPPAVTYYAKLCTDYAKDKPGDFNRTLKGYSGWLAADHLQPEMRKASQEYFFNHYAPFYKSMVIYVFALLLACASWLNWSEWLNRTAFGLLVLAFVIHTSGLIFRMYLERRPPVTNLYSSAIYVGWGAVLLGIILERIYRDGIGTVTASSVGFITLIIAHHLAASGDTMEMLRAVLDTNLWLATHVVAITTGYASMFLAGFLAIVYLVRGLFTRSLNRPTAKSLSRMVYGIICFATLFSFVGTILGGIWADQSWGRFWGWDPKENGALLIVLWCAIILHARWGGMIRERGLMNMAIFGNVVTSWSWFGVNMLGIGLHSYGFMAKAFPWLIFFIASQLVLIGLGLIPQRYWASFRPTVRGPAQKPLATPSATGPAKPHPA